MIGKKVKDYVKTRSLGQIRSHAQKFILHICKNQSIKNKGFMESIKRLDFKSKNYSELFKNDIHLLKKETFTYDEMDEIERKIILKFKINYSKEYACLNYKNGSNEQETKKREKKRTRIKFNCEDKTEGDPKKRSYLKKVLIRKINNHFEKIKKFVLMYNNLFQNQQITVLNPLTITTNYTETKEVSFTNAHLSNTINNYEDEYLNSFEFNESSNIFSLFNTENIDQLCSKSFISNEENMV